MRKNLKQYMAASLALLMMLTPLSNVVTAYALEEDTTGIINLSETSVSDSSEAVLTTEIPLFSVTIPTIMPVDIDENNNVTVATDVTLTNNGAGPVYVSSISILEKNEWKQVVSVSDKTGKTEFSMNVEVIDRIIPANASTGVVYSALVSPQQSEISNASMADVVFTVNWYGTSEYTESLKAGENKTTTVELNEDAGVVIWASSDESVATVEGIQDDTFSLSKQYKANITAIKAGTSTITATPEVGETQTITVTVKDGGTVVPPVDTDEPEVGIIESIVVTSQPTKVTYTEGSKFDTTGLIITAIYKSGKQEVIQDYEVKNGETLALGQTSVKIAKGDIEIEVVITVEAIAVEAVSISVHQQPSKLVYNVGENFSDTDLQIAVEYSNGDSTIATSGWTILNGSNLQIGTTSVTIQYLGLESTIAIEVAEPVITKIEISSPPLKTEYTEGSNFEPSGLVVNGVYTDGQVREISLDEVAYINGANLAEGATFITVTYKGFSVNVNITVSSKYVLATDADFSGTKDGSFIYIGTAKNVEVPYIIKGIPVTSYTRMFSNTSVEGVKSTNTNVTNMQSMFYNSKATTLDISSFDTSNVTNMSYMFYDSKATTLNLSSFDTSNVTTMQSMFNSSLATILDLSSFNTSKVTNMLSMFSSLQATTLDISNFNTSNVTDMQNMFYYSKVTTLDLSSFDTSNVTNMGSMFSNSQATTLDISSFDTSNVIYMSGMFQSSKANTLDISNFNTSNVTDMQNMFYYSKVTTLDLSSFDTSNVTNMQGMFEGSQATTLDLSNFNTSNVTNMQSMFYNSKATTLDISNFNTSNVTNMENMLGNSKATTLDISSFDTSNVTTMQSMFNSSLATILDLSSFDTSNVTNMHSMFEGSQATTLDLSSFDTSNVTNMQSMFYNSKATTLDISSFNTSNVIYMGSMFYNSQATTLDISSFDTSNVTNMENMFKNSQATTGYARTQADANKFNATSSKPAALIFKVSKAYKMATDADFSGTTNGSFKYIGTEKYVEVPHIIKGVPVTSYYNMFSETLVEGVKSTNTNVRSMDSMFNNSQATTLDLSRLDTSNVTSMSYMFNYSRAITLDLLNFNTSKVTKMFSMFEDARATILNISSFDTSNVTDMSFMFSTSQATTLDMLNFDTSNVTDMRCMFSASKATTLDLSSFNTYNVTDMYGMFDNSHATALDISSFDTSNVTNMSEMFSRLRVTTLDLSGLNTFNVTNMDKMFYVSETTNIDLSSFDTSNVTSMSYMFKDSKATTLDLSSFDTSNVTDMSIMFYGAEAITGYARTQADADKFNASSGKPEALIFTTKSRLATNSGFSSIQSNTIKTTENLNNPEISTTIRGLSLTSYSEMFKGTEVGGINSSTTTIVENLVAA